LGIFQNQRKGFVIRFGRLDEVGLVSSASNPHGHPPQNPSVGFASVQLGEPCQLGCRYAQASPENGYHRASSAHHPSFPSAFQPDASATIDLLIGLEVSPKLDAIPPFNRWKHGRASIIQPGMMLDTEFGSHVPQNNMAVLVYTIKHGFQLRRFDSLPQ